MALAQPGNKVLLISPTKDNISSTLRNDLSQASGASEIVEGDYSNLTPLREGWASGFDSVVIASNDPGVFKQDVLESCWKALKPSGKLSLLPLFQRDLAFTSQLSTLLTLTGFIDQNVSEHLGHVLVASFRPSYVAGTTDRITLKKKKTTPVADAWSQPLGSDSGADLVDESSLLTEADLSKPLIQDDCEVGSTKKACKNCTCGRAEMEEQGVKPKITLAMLENPAVNSSCGSCSLGDAHRCAGCPYRGLPAFTPGQKIVLPDDFDMDSIES